MLLPLITAAATAAPAQFTYQARLLDASGEPIEAEQSISFELFADSDASSPFWTESQTLDPEAGFISTVLGANEANEIPVASMLPGPAEIRVAWAGGATTRQALTSVPYAAVGGTTATVEEASDVDANDTIVITHPADPDHTRTVTVLEQATGAHPNARFFVNFDDHTDDAVTGSPISFVGDATIVADGRFGNGLYASTDVNAARWDIPSGTVAFGTADFTMRLWYKTDLGHQSGGYWGGFLGTVTGSTPNSSQWIWAMREHDGNRVHHGGGFQHDEGDSWGPAVPGQWYHLALEREEDTFRFYVDGTMVDTWTSSAIFGSGQTTLFLGGIIDYDNTPGLHFDELEILEGAQYGGAAFTPPTTASGATGTYRVTPEADVRIEYTSDTTTTVTRIGSGVRQHKVVVRTD